ncbi:hypothetical protein [Acinetobacter sp.]|jgi:hypothetical protein|uniref:Uncharacterized protein n=1 Tax=Acinetobacter bereziniae TaxID=106648 RepID=A0A833PAU2_ACIBZ|nr:hypothetical protein [Acinetobacter sp.]KAF1015297.1 MAG: hypothetical protein GAK29_04619 [Acinetobacter bereziniae]MDR0236529.1 hypothetical protein [Acinetobacter sp.]
MFEVDSFQERYMDDEDDKRWLYRVLLDLANLKYPLLKPNLENNKDLSNLLDQVIADANEYDFLDDDELLIRYALYAVNRKETPMQNPELREAIEKSETIKIGIQDQSALADWVVRMKNLFNKQVLGVD